MLTEFKNWYKSLRKNKNNAVFSPHKPLTILYALSKIRKGQRWIDYSQDREELEEFIWDFTNLKTKPNCLNPLWRLRNDSKDIPIWSCSPEDLKTDQSGSIYLGEARDRGFKAGFSDHYYEYLKNNQWLVQKLIGDIIEDNFPDTLTESILVKLDLDELPPEVVRSEKLTSVITKPKRDPNFPKRVLSIYDNRCCFCGLKLYLNNSPLPMEAAHIKWKAQGGDCLEDNGLALCPTHHFAFDRGLWSIKDDFRIFLSPKALVDGRSDPFFKPFIGVSIAERILDQSLLPSDVNIKWHRKNILK